MGLKLRGILHSTSFLPTFALYLGTFRITSTLKIGLFDNLSDEEYSSTKAFESDPEVELGSEEEVEWEDDPDYDTRAF